MKSWWLADTHGQTFGLGLLCAVGECFLCSVAVERGVEETAQKWNISLMARVWSQLQFLAFSIFRDTSGVTNRINKRLITLKGNSSGFNRILITAYRCLLVTP